MISLATIPLSALSSDHALVQYGDSANRLAAVHSRTASEIAVLTRAQQFVPVVGHNGHRAFCEPSALGHRGESPRPIMASSQQGRAPVACGRGQPAHCPALRVVKKSRASTWDNAHSRSSCVGIGVSIAVKRTHSARATGVLGTAKGAHHHAWGMYFFLTSPSYFSFTYPTP